MTARHNPVVEGVLSPQGVFNHPEAAFCRRSGARLGASRTLRIVVGEPTPAVVVVTGDGKSTAMRGPLVLGREPETHPGVVGGAADPVAVGAGDHLVSRHHLLLRYSGWDVIAVDLGSRNGTAVTRSSGTRLEVRPEPGVVVAHGDRIHLGWSVVWIYSLVGSI